MVVQDGSLSRSFPGGDAMDDVTMPDAVEAEAPTHEPVVETPAEAPAEPVPDAPAEDPPA